MPLRYQYPAKVQPVSTSPESVHVDAWMQPPTPPQRNWAVRSLAFAAVLAAVSGAVSDPKLLTQKEAVHVENFRLPEYPAVYLRRDTRYQGYSAALDASGMAVIDAKQLTLAETVRIDKFKPDYDDIVPVRRRSVALLGQHVTDPKLLTQKESVSVDKFSPNYPSQFARTYPQAVYSVNGFVRSTETVTLDKWWEAPSIPVRTVPNFAATASSGHQQFPVVLSRFQPRSYYADSVIRQYPTATYVASGWTGPSVIIEQILLDKWFQSASQPAYPAKVCPTLSQSVTDSRLLTQKETVSIDRWGQPTNQPVNLLRGASLGWYVSDPKVVSSAETITLDKWWQAASVPTRLPVSVAQTAGSGHSEFPVVLYHFQPRSYYADSVSRPFPTGTYAASGWSGPILVPAPPDVVTLDKWFHEQPDWIARPYPLAIYQASGHLEGFHQAHGAYTPFYAQYPNSLARIYSTANYVSGSTAPIIVTAPEVVTLDKWWEAASQPTYLPRRTAEGRYVTDPNLLTQKESVSIDKFGPDYPVSIAKAPLDPMGWFVTDPKFAFDGGINIAKFGPSYPSSITKAPLPNLGYYVIDPKLLTLPEGVSLDRFQAHYADFVRGVPNAAFLEASGGVFLMYIPPPIITRGAWIALVAGMKISK
jgi:hypothetical protein